MKKQITSFLLIISTCYNLPLLANEIPKTLFTNVHLFDGKQNQITENAFVLVEGNHIAKISTTPIEVEGAKIIDGQGNTLMPGMIDAHSHVMLSDSIASMMTNQDITEYAVRGSRRAYDYLMAGFTSVRDLGGNSMGIKKAIDSGVYPGPRIYPSGPAISQTAGHGDFRMPADGNVYFNGRQNAGVAEIFGMTHLADGADEVRRAVREYLYRGASQIKIHAGGGVTSFKDPLEATQYTLEEMQAATEEATRAGTYVAAHVHDDVSTNIALDAGIRSIEHGTILKEDTLKRMAKLGVYYTPQLYLSLQDVSNSPMFTSPIQIAKLKRVAEGAADSIQWAKKYNVKILWGSDVFLDNNAFNNVTQEFAYRDRFFSATEQLKQVTSNNAEALADTGLRNPYPERKLGVIESGAYADMIIVKGDPTKNIKILMDSNNIALIMKDGEIYKNNFN